MNERNYLTGAALFQNHQRKKNKTAIYAHLTLQLEKENKAFLKISVICRQQRKRKK